jgi:hypothetical protein
MKQSTRPILNQFSRVDQTRAVVRFQRKGYNPKDVKAMSTSELTTRL